MIRRAFSFVTEDLNEKAVVMKKIFTWVIVLVLAVCSLSFGACDKDKGGKFTFCVPDGAPALAVAKFIKDKENFTALNLVHILKDKIESVSFRNEKMKL